MKHAQPFLIGNRSAIWVHPTKTLKRLIKVGEDKISGEGIYMVGTTDGCIGIIGKDNVRDFYKKMKEYYKSRKGIKVKVKFINNKNRVK
jgi:hypothetical protein